MILLCNGDSWTQGDNPSQILNWEAEKTLDWYDIIPHFGNPTHLCDKRTLYKFYDSQVWPKVLGEKLGVETWNAGRLGASNDRIFRGTINSINYLESLGKKDLFLVVGLTSVFRYETWNVYKPYVWADERVDATTFTAKNHVPFQIYIDSLVYKTIINIVNLQNFCKVKNIPYLIFSAFDDMDEDLKSSGLYKYIDLENIYNNNFKGHFKEYIEDNFSASWKKESYFIGGHPTDLSHIEWANELNRYIKELGIV
jgi:hypothetical protein